ncbi:MAG: hypothetical protein HOP19_27935 [Acidobacteria bacterium]|nr:hypothetical protein [Acidobacteriota bacterium]
MNRKIMAALFVAAIACVTSAQPAKLNLSGTWERLSVSGYGNPGTETMTFVHNEPYLYLLYRIKDGAGERTLDLKGMIDGKPHKQEIDEQPAILIAQWEGKNFILDIKRERPTGYVHNRRKITFSNDGKVMTVERTQHSKEGTLLGTGAEKWERK